MLRSEKSNHSKFAYKMPFFSGNMLNLINSSIIFKGVLLSIDYEYREYDDSFTERE